MAFQLDTDPKLSPSVQEIAKNELRETPEVVEPAIKELRRLIEEDPNLHYRTDDAFLTVFLRPCKFYPESAYQLMQRIANFKVKYSDLLTNLLPMDEQNAFTNHNVVNVLTNRDHKGRRVLLVNVGESWKTSEVSSDQLFRIFYLIHEAAILEPETQVCGVVVIMDFKGLGMKQVAALSPSFSVKLLTFIQDAMPLRLKEVHMVFNPMIFNIVWKVFQPFIREKLRGRIHMHKSNMAKLHEFIPKTHLPADYGGDLPKINYSGADWFPCIEGYVEHFKQLNTYGVVKK